MDENFQMIYQSKSDMPKRFTEEELFFVNELGMKEKIKAIFYQDENENERIFNPKGKKQKRVLKRTKKNICFWIILEQYWSIRWGLQERM